MKAKESVVGFLGLFGSTATLLCCALPALVAAIAGGSAVVSIVGSLPWLVPLSQNKGWLFLGSGALITMNGVLTLRPKGRVACSVTGGKGCEAAGTFQKAMFWLSIILLALGLFFSYGFVPVLRWFDT